MPLGPVGIRHGRRESLEEPTIGVETFAQDIDPQIADPNHHKTASGQQGRFATLPAFGDAGVEIGGED